MLMADCEMLLVVDKKTASRESSVGWMDSGKEKDRFAVERRERQNCLLSAAKQFVRISVIDLSPSYSVLSCSVSTYLLVFSACRETVFK